MTTNNDIYMKLDTLYTQLEAQDQKTLGWRRHIEDQLRRIEDTVNRIENAQRR